METSATIKLVRQYIAQGKLVESLQLCQQVLERSPNCAIAYQCLGEGLEAQGKITAAIAAYTKAIAIQPDLPEANAYLGDLYSLNGQLSEAARSYQTALAVRPHWVELHFNLGHVFHQQQDLERAVCSYRQAIAHNPNYEKAFYNLGVVLEQQEQWLAAIQAYARAIALQPENLNARNNLGCLLIMQDRAREAVTVFQQALSLKPDWATLHNNLGRALLAQNQTGAAIATFNQALQLRPDMALAHYNLGKAWQLEGCYTQAIKCFEQAIALNPELEIAYSNCSTLLLFLQQLDQAVPYLQYGLKPLEFVISYCRAAFEMTATDEMDRVRVACAKFLVALWKLEISDSKHDCSLLTQLLSQIYIHSGHVCFEYGDYGQAEVYYRYSLKLTPHIPQLFTWLGDCLVKQKRFNDAAVHYHLALELQPNDYETSFKLGQTLAKLENWEQAIATLIPPRDVCEGLNCIPCLQKLRLSFSPIHLGKGIYQCFHGKHGPRNFATYPLTVVKIPDGKAWIVPNRNYWQVCNAIAILTADNFLLADLSRDYPGQLPICQQYHPTQHLLFWQESLPPLKQIEGTVAVLSGLSGNVYFHWMVDVLPRLEVLRRHDVAWEEIDWFLVNSCAAPFQRQTLEILGIPPHQILESDRYSYIQAQQLIVPSFAGYLGWLDDWALQFLRETFLPKALTSAMNVAKYPERIYISRAKAKYRKIYNEVEVINLLSQYGFVTVNLEFMSFLEQVRLFAQAKVIVGAHGSGLTNTIFCDRGTTVIEIFSPHYVRQYFWVISQQLQLKHYYLLSEAFACEPLRQLMYFSPLIEDIWVNLKQLQAAIEMAIP